jgi:hypothetical protein
MIPAHAVAAAAADEDGHEEYCKTSSSSSALTLPQTDPASIVENFLPE